MVGRVGMIGLAMAAALASVGGQPATIPERERYSAPRPPIRKPKTRKPYEAKVETGGGPDLRDDKYLHSAARRRRLAELVKGD